MERMTVNDALPYLTADDLDALHEMAEAHCEAIAAVDEPIHSGVDTIAAYADGYQQAIDPGWPDPNHIGTESYEAGYDDGLDRRLGDSPYTDDIAARLSDLGIG